MEENAKADEYQVIIHFDNGTSRLGHDELLTYFLKEAKELRAAYRKFYGKTATKIELKKM